MAKPQSLSNFREREVEACQRILLEVLNLLHEHFEHIALIGGWVPFYLLHETSPAHIGSLDVDLCFDHANITDAAYETIARILTSQNYYQDAESPVEF